MLPGMFIDIGGIPTWWYITALALAVLIIGIAKSGFGGGIGILAVPLTASALPPQMPQVALGMMLPILIAADVVAVWQHRGNQSWWRLRWSLGAALIGIVAAGALVIWFRSGSTDAARQQQLLGSLLGLLVGGLCLMLVLIQCYRFLGGKLPRVPDTRTSATTAGGVAGFVSMLSHGAGPIMSVYLLEQRMEKRLLVGTLAVFFFAVNVMKVPVYVQLDWIIGWTLAESAMWFVLVPVGGGLGLWMHKRIPERPFTAIMYLGAAAAAANMIYKAIVHWPATSPS